MASKEKIMITVSTTINATIDKVWKRWTNPDDITKWNHASDDWYTTKAENDLRVGGKFFSRMEAKDGSMGFDFIGVYDEIIPNGLISYKLEDERKVKVVFKSIGKETQIVETFEAETINSVELQKSGWQSILDNFKKYVEKSN